MRGGLQIRRSLPILLLVVATRLPAQSAATVPASSAVYERLESVSAWFPARGVFLGERALSRREVERVVLLLTRKIDSAVDRSAERRDWARGELNLVASALKDVRGRRTGDRTQAGVAWRGDLLSSRAQFERIEPNGLGAIDAVSHPFIAGRHGWPVVRGTMATIAPTGVLGTKERVAIVTQPTLSLTPMQPEGWTSERFLRRGYARAVLANVAAQVGADEHRWGQSPHGALFISGNALPLPAISLATDTAITLPWLFRLAGPVRATAFLADLGAAQIPPHARLAGWQVSIQPWSRFELGVAVSTQTGGNGGPPATFLERVIDLFPVIDALSPAHSDLQISNKLAGGNLRLRFPELSGLDLYYELQIDDFDGRRLRSSLVDDAAHVLGLRLPILVNAGQFTWRAEWHRMAIRLYEHTQFRSGSTYRGRIIGNPLGPHAAGGYLSAAWQPSPTMTIAIGAADERRDPSLYNVTVSGPRDRGFTFVRLTDDPDFRRRRVEATVERLIPGGAVHVTVGHNRAWRTAQAGRGEWLGLLSIRSLRLTTF
jgi:hypothetical protein